jgi:hypothetical protein
MSASILRSDFRIKNGKITARETMRYSAEFMRRTSPNSSSLLGAIGLAVGCIGSFMESWFLRHELADCYPFKMMTAPPPEFYRTASITLSSFAPYVACVAGIVLILVLKRTKIVAGLVALAVCPLGYVLGLLYLVSVSDYGSRLYDADNFDHIPAAVRHQEFYFDALQLFLFSACIYLVFLSVAFAITYIFKSKKIP